MSYLPVYFFFQHAVPQGKPVVILFIAIFPLIGIGALIWAIRQTVRLIRFGKTFVQLQTLPASLGRSLKGSIEARLPYPLPDGINLALSCVNRVTTGGGKNQSTFDYIRWQGKKELGPETIMAGPSGSTIPVDFDVPRDMPPSNTSNPSNEILWLLRAEADVPGVDFDETYEVPVFETQESPVLRDCKRKRTWKNAPIRRPRPSAPPFKFLPPLKVAPSSISPPDTTSAQRSGSPFSYFSSAEHKRSFSIFTHP
jgi:hypothetical protein